MKFPKIVLVIASLSSLATAAQDSVITAFEKKIAFQFQAKYNYASFTGESTQDEYIETNRPIDLGIGGGYGDWTWSSLWTVSFGEEGGKPKTSALDLQLNYFGDRIFGRAYFRLNRGFCWEDPTGRWRKLDIRTIIAGYNLNLLWNPEHSIRAAYALDRRQWKSNGSFLVGFGIYYNGVVSHEPLYDDYKKFQHLIHVGPDVGYSYTWVWNNGIFLNAMGVAAISFGQNVTRSKWMGFWQLFPKLAPGYHGESWSIHFPVDFSVIRLRTQGNNMGEGDVLIVGSAGFMVTRRF